MFPSSRPHCPTCPFANFINVFNDLNSSVSCSICYNLSCASSSVIYIIECSLCHERYVGQARRSLRDRIKQHLRTLRAPSHSSLLQDNFNVCGLTNFSFSPSPTTTTISQDLPRRPPGSERCALFIHETSTLCRTANPSLILWSSLSEAALCVLQMR